MASPSQHRVPSVQSRAVGVLPAVSAAVRPRIALAVSLTAALAAAAAGVPAASQVPTSSARARDAQAILQAARQLLVVVTPGWDDVRGELRRFERRNASGRWIPVGGPVDIVVGHKGTAWDPAIDTPLPGPRKAEGDGRSPAGVFTLGHAFGYAPVREASWLDLPYIPVAEGIECVDDPDSTFYNRIVDRRTVQAPDWKSSEKMREAGEAYRWGVVVEYNTRPAVARRGSCIFLHIGGEQGHGTVGCTAMAAPELRIVMEWLDASRQPALVQIPRHVYEEMKGAWALP